MEDGEKLVIWNSPGSIQYYTTGNSTVRNRNNCFIDDFNHIVWEVKDGICTVTINGQSDTISGAQGISNEKISIGGYIQYPNNDGSVVRECANGIYKNIKILGIFE